MSSIASKGKKPASHPSASTINPSVPSSTADDDAGESSSDTSDSESDSSLSSSSGDDESTDDEFGAVSPEYLESLLEKARENMAARARSKAASALMEEEEIRLPGEGSSK